MRKQHLVSRGRTHIFAAAGCAALGISGALTSAADITWDNSSADAKWFTNTNWDGDVVPTSNDPVIFPAGFPGGDSTIDLTNPSPAVAQGLTINDSYTFGNGTLHVSNGVVNVAAGKTARMNGAMIPDTANGLDKIGAGELVLTTSVASPYFASIGSGKLRLESAGIISGSTVSSGGALELGGITSNLNVTALSGSMLSGTGTSALTGILHVNPSTKLTLRTDGTLTLGDEPNDVTGGGNSYIGVEGTGTVVLAQPSDITTRWALNGGTLQIGDDNRLGAAASDLMFGGGTLVATGTFTSPRGVFLNSTGGTFDVASSKTLTLTAPLNGVTNSVLTKTGAGKLALSATSTRTGATSILDGTLELDAPDALGTSSSTLTSASPVQANAPQHLSSLSIGNATVHQIPGGENTLVLGQLTLGQVGIATTAKLDVGDNSAIVQTTPIGSCNGSVYTGLSGMIQKGHGGGEWDGSTGILSSDSRAASGLCAIGIASASQVLGIDSTATGTWHGQTVTGTDSLIAFTYGGDANLDGKIDIDDYGRIDSNVGQSGSVFGWYNGDFNYDGKINIDDYGIIDSNIGAQGSPLVGAPDLGAGAPAVSAVPEPASLGAILMSAVVLKRRRSGGRRSRA